jgi:hypothetical protein
MVIHRRFISIHRANHPVLWKSRSNFIIKDVGPVGKHGSDITMKMWAAATLDCGRRPKNQIRYAVMFLLKRRTPEQSSNDPKSPKEDDLWQARQVRFGQVH